MNQGNAERRWDTDTIGHGVADGTAFAPGVQRLLDALQRPDWVAEDPDAHLLPHLRRVYEAAASPWKLLATEWVDGVYEVILE